MSDKNTQYTPPLICGLHAATVIASEHNKNGECGCIGCVGNHCHDCGLYVAKVRARAELPITEKSVCDKCLMLTAQRTR